MYCLNFFFFPVVGIKWTDRNNLKKKGFILAHTSKVQNIIVGKSSWQGLKQLVTLHSLLESSEQWLCTTAQFPLSMHRVQDPNQEMASLIVSRSFYIIPKTIHRNMPREEALLPGDSTSCVGNTIDVTSLH